MAVAQFAPRPPAPESPYRRFEIRCATCGSHRVDVAGGHDEEAGEFRVLLRCRGCRAEERVTLR